MSLRPFHIGGGVFSCHKITSAPSGGLVSKPASAGLQIVFFLIGLLSLFLRTTHINDLRESMGKVLLQGRNMKSKEIRKLLIGDIEEAMETAAMEKFLPVHESSRIDELENDIEFMSYPLSTTQINYRNIRTFRNSVDN